MELGASPGVQAAVRDWVSDLLISIDPQRRNQFSAISAILLATGRERRSSCERQMGTKSAVLRLVRTRQPPSAPDRRGRGGGGWRLGRRDANGLTERLRAQVTGGGAARDRRKGEEHGKRGRDGDRAGGRAG